MCTYLNKTDSTYYFRRPVPDDLPGHFTTERGNPCTEWKSSLNTKDREEAKRLLRPHAIETDKLIECPSGAQDRASAVAGTACTARAGAGGARGQGGAGGSQTGSLCQPRETAAAHAAQAAQDAEHG